MGQIVNPFSSSEPLRQVQLYLVGFNLALCTEAGFLLYVVDMYVFITSWRITPCHLSATAYSVYSQLPFIPGGCLLHPQPEAMPW
jgi:hypothetical protein